jgi:hypothetical protein
MEGATLSGREVYDALGGDLPAVLVSNLNRSDSAICLAGRVLGKAESERMVARVRFRIGEQVVDLPTLLTVYGWSNSEVSRVSFFNPRTGDFDRRSGSPRLTIADGVGTFLKIVDADEFHHSNIVGIIHRAIEREALEAVGTKLSALSQWYVPDPVLEQQLPPAPPGVSFSLLKRRNP